MIKKISKKGGIEMFPLIPVVITTTEATQLFIAGVTAGTAAAAVVKKKKR